MNEAKLAVAASQRDSAPTEELHEVGPSSWSQWWPAGFLLAGIIFGLTYLRAWSGETGGVHLMFWAAIATMVIATFGPDRGGADAGPRASSPRSPSGVCSISRSSSTARPSSTTSTSSPTCGRWNT